MNKCPLAPWPCSGCSTQCCPMRRDISPGLRGWHRQHHPYNTDTSQVVTNPTVRQRKKFHLLETSGTRGRVPASTHPYLLSFTHCWLSTMPWALTPQLCSPSNGNCLWKGVLWAEQSRQVFHCINATLTWVNFQSSSLGLSENLLLVYFTKLCSQKAVSANGLAATHCTETPWRIAVAFKPETRATKVRHFIPWQLDS